MTSSGQDDPFVRSVRKQAARTERGKRASLISGFGLVGVIGWMVVLPTLLGAALGRFLDGRFGTGIVWTLSLLLVGLVLGGLAAWRDVQEAVRS